MPVILKKDKEGIWLNNKEYYLEKLKQILWAEEDLNLHELPRLLLRQVRLPISQHGHFVASSNLTPLGYL